MNARNPIGQFGHFENPAIDFAFEVEKIANLVEAVEARTTDAAAAAERIDRAMEFRVGGTSIGVDAKARLRGIATRFAELQAAIAAEGAYWQAHSGEDYHVVMRSTESTDNASIVIRGKSWERWEDLNRFARKIAALLNKSNWA